MNLSLSVDDILLAALLACVITFIIVKISSSFNKLFSSSVTLSYSQNDLSKVMKRCYKLFPKELLHFKGQTFTRGAWVRVTTNKKKVFEGKFIGINDEDIACFVTKSFIVAQEVEGISNIDLLK